MRVAAVQMAPGEARDANLARAETLIAAAAESAPALVSLPEMWTCLGGTREAKWAAAETLPASCGRYGPAAAFLREAARRHRIVLHGGSVGERDGEHLYNTTLVFGPDGAELGRYRKIHLFDATTPDGAPYGESRAFAAGERVAVCDTPAGRLGLSICYDLRFPALYAALRRAGAAVIAVPSAFTAETGRAHWEVLLRARAIETQCAVVAAATTGTHRDGAGRPRTTWGHSAIVDAWGRVLAEAADGEGFCTAEIDGAAQARVRDAMPVLSHARTI